MLDMDGIMVNKLLCGDLVPSRHLEKQMIEVLGIQEHRVSKMAHRRENRSPKKSQAAAPRRKAA